MMRTAVVLSALGLVAGLGASLAAPALAQLSPQSNAPIDVTGDQLEAQPQQCLAIYRGNVEALQGTSRLRTDVLDLYARQGAPTQQSGAGAGVTGAVASKCGALERMEAHGSVYYVTPSEVVKGDDAVYLADAKTITVTGDVVVSQGKNVVVGNRLVINTDTQHATMESNVTGPGKAGRVRSVLYPSNQGVGIFQSAPSKP
ncbi:MAG TPA: LptA/OstA family protein [Caulobacteraceae bacterium]|jgi:lipopolysaccharide export system protein LptA|nr:LptA/OstA family protein [Caulobacteraceae bacterium]